MKTLLILSLFLVLACASNPVNQFEKIKKGMDKDQVLSIIGSPKITNRTNGIEKWSYQVFPGNDETEVYKFVKFFNGKVIDFGNDTEEAERLEDFKQSSEKREAYRKKKEAVSKKIEQHYQNKKKSSSDDSEEEN